MKLQLSLLLVCALFAPCALVAQDTAFTYQGRLNHGGSPANAREVLDKVTALPMTSWNYKTQEKSVRHLGPMAQDFHAAFGLGENDRTITTVDADGVALAAIQGLNAKLEEQIKARDTRITELERRLAGIEKLLAMTAAK